MLIEPPKIDKRKFQDLLDEIKKIAPFYVKELNTLSNWDSNDDSGSALAKIFSDILMEVITRLNKVPEKNFITFLDTLGVKLTPAQPARTALVFKVANGALDVLVPESAQTEASATEEHRALIFETEKKILATTSALKKVYSVVPKEDRIFSHTKALNDGEVFELFTKQDIQEHAIYFGHEDLFNITGEANIELIISYFPDSLEKMKLVSWQYYGKKIQIVAGQEVETKGWFNFSNVYIIENDKDKLNIYINIELEKCDNNEIIKYKINEIESRWIRCIIGVNAMLSEYVPAGATKFKVDYKDNIQKFDKLIIADWGKEDDKIKEPSKAEFVKVTENSTDEIHIEEKLTYAHDKGILVKVIRDNVEQDLEILKNLTIDTIAVRIPQSPGVEADLLFSNDIPLSFAIQSLAAIYPFGRYPKTYDTFYIASKDAFSKKGTNVTLTMNVCRGFASTNDRFLSLSWEYWNGNGWQAIEGFIDKTDRLTKNGCCDVNFQCPADIKNTLVNGEDNYWVRVRIANGDYGRETFTSVPDAKVTWKPNWDDIKPPKILNLLISYSSNKDFDLQHCLLSNNLEFQDVTQKSKAKDDLFLPFQFFKDPSQELYLGFDKQLLKGPISLFFSLEQQRYPDEKRPRIKWYYYAKTGEWTRLEVVDSTGNLTESGTVQLLGPADFDSVSRFGEKLYWIKAVNVENPFKPISFRRLGSPSGWTEEKIEHSDLKSLSGQNDKSLSMNDETDISCNEFLFSSRDFIDPVRLAKKLNLSGQNEKAGNPLSVYIQKHFDPEKLQELDNKDASSEDISEIIADEFNKLILDGSVHNELEIELTDETLKLIEQKPQSVKSFFIIRNILETAYPYEIAKRIGPCPEECQYFGPGFQISGESIPSPKIKGIYVNATWGIQGATIRDEILGSSNGIRLQTFKFTHYPVISETIQVNEIGSISEEEKNNLLNYDESIEYEGEKAISIFKNDSGGATEIWVRWDRVDDFLKSNSKSRHYIINHFSGDMQFGNGNKGMIPPIKKNNIRATYQWGGGKAGNIKASEVKSLKSSVPSVDEVSNPEPAGAGSDTETIERLLERGPQILRNRGRAVTFEDYQWIAKEASPDIARAKCIPNFNNQGKFEPGWVTVTIVPESSDEKPVPSPLLIKKVKNYLEERCSTVVVTGKKLQVIEPVYIKVTVTADIYVNSMDDAPDAERKGLASLKAFLHPLTGGSDGLGWEFGRMVCFSDLYALLEKITKIDHIDNLVMLLEHNGQKKPFSSEEPVEISIPQYALIYSGEHSLTPRFKEGITDGQNNK